MRTRRMVPTRKVSRVSERTSTTGSQPRETLSRSASARISTETRRRRRAWIMEAWAADVPGLVRCYRCGKHLYNPDTPPVPLMVDGDVLVVSGNQHDYTQAAPLTVDRIIPGCKGGTYRRDNVRPACADCNSVTGGGLRSNNRKRPTA